MADPRSPRARRSGGRAPRGRNGADLARDAAYDVLRAVSSADAYANLTLPGRLTAHQVRGRDAAFATELVSGTLRRQGTYDLVLGACLTRAPAALDPPVLDVLRLGAHQLLGMRVPTHAAVATSVDLVRRRVGHGPAGLVNAVLRRVAERSVDAWVRLLAPDPGVDPVGFAAVAHAHPRWVVEELTAALGPRRDELEALLAADNAAPRVTLVARPGLCEQEELASAGAEMTAYSTLGAVMPSGEPGVIPAVAQGRAGVQDEGSQLVALALLDAPLAGSDSRWLDTCAGPGGKAAVLGAAAGLRSATLLAAERQSHRAALVVGATRALPPGSVRVVIADATSPAWPAESFDRVLLDAPCSGLGALRRRPEARWRRSTSDLRELVSLQRALLRSALHAVRPGGVVAYATCSPVLAETAGVVAGLLEERSDVRIEAPSGVLAAVPDSAGPMPGTVQLWPHRHDTDAMFLALLRRT